MRKIAPPEEIHRKFVLDLEAIQYFETKYKRDDRETKKAIRKKQKDEAKNTINESEDKSVKAAQEVTFSLEVLPPSSSPTHSLRNFLSSISSDSASDSYYTANEYPATSSDDSLSVPSSDDSPYVPTQAHRVTKEVAPGEPVTSRRKGPLPSIPYTSLEDLSYFRSTSRAVNTEDIPRTPHEEGDFVFPDTISSSVRLESEFVKCSRFYN